MSEYNFLGTITNKIESQGRMKFPAKFRRGGDSAKNEPFVLVRGLDGCIRVYPEEEWVKIRQKLDKIDLSQQKLRDFKRCFLTDVSEVTIDAQGRIKISQNLLKFARIERSVIIHGMISYIELWCPELFNKKLFEIEESFAEIAEGLNLEG
ncbi:MAG: division/cell wall cluster transcriptional repressor MraZ [candidate division Zixibacteria bacterium CG_4_9_14_3_um_filter_46_8]|nr:MAG: division/cell wall cluster transcriptional repressor MraZ [candidate division Zixibacteria bacterium CG_4_9_14_3_um_filter_46_8]